MSNGYISIKKSMPLNGVVMVSGAKNAVLVIMASLILTDGVSILENVPNNTDVLLMITLLEELGARIMFDRVNNILTVDTFGIHKYEIQPEIMNKIRASILIMGPLLARFGVVKVAIPGGDLIGARPLNYHFDGLRHLGVIIQKNDPFIEATASKGGSSRKYVRIALEYPSVGATENIMMFACLWHGDTVIINAAIEPEVVDLVHVLRKMGANITLLPEATIYIKGVSKLLPVKHAIVADRLEAGTLLVAAAITGGSVTIPNARPEHLDVFLYKLQEMGHEIHMNIDDGQKKVLEGITFNATKHPKGIHVKTGPYPGLPTDLQPCLMAALCVAKGISIIEETVFENRMIHTKELGKMGAQISLDGSRATIHGVDDLYGTEVIASDIRASSALVLAGLVAHGQTIMTGINHWFRGYDKLEKKLQSLGACVDVFDLKISAIEIQQLTRQPLL